MSFLEPSNLAKLSIEQEGHLWPAMLLDAQHIEVLRSERSPVAGRTNVCVDYGEVTASVAATIATVETSQLGYRLALKADDEALWNYCLEAAKSNNLVISDLISNTRPGIGMRPAIARRNAFVARQLPRIAAVALAIAVLTQGYHRFFFATSAEASVATDEILVGAAGSGRVIFATPRNEVREGEPVAGIARSRSRDRAMESPCDCIVSRRFVSKGSWVGKADPLIGLSRLDAPRYIRALLPAADIPQLLRSGVLTFEFQDGSRAQIRVPADEIINGSKSNRAGLVELNLDPGRELPLRMIGEPVRLSYATLPAPLEIALNAFGVVR